MKSLSYQNDVRENTHVAASKPVKSGYASCFEYSTTDSEKFGKCILCAEKKIPKIIKMKNANTTGLKKHLRCKHRKVFEKMFGNAAHDERQKLMDVHGYKKEVNCLTYF